MGTAGLLLAALHLLDLVGVLPLVAVFVVLSPFLGVREDLVGGVDLFEAGFGLGVSGVDVGVVPAGQAAIGRLDLFLRGRAGNAEDLVVVPGHAALTIAGVQAGAQP